MPVEAQIEGYKWVPLGKKDRIRREMRSFILSQPDRRAHRTQIAEHLDVCGLQVRLGTLSIYASRWSEIIKQNGGWWSIDEHRQG